MSVYENPSADAEQPDPDAEKRSKDLTKKTRKAAHHAGRDETHRHDAGTPPSGASFTSADAAGTDQWTSLDGGAGLAAPRTHQNGRLP